VAVNDVKTFGAITEGVEYTSSLVSRFAALEELYLSRPSRVEVQLRESIVGLYAAVLTYLSKASRYYGRKTCVRFGLSVLEGPETSAQPYLNRLSTEESRVDSLARLVDAEYSWDVFEGVSLVKEKLNNADGRMQALEGDVMAQFSQLKRSTDSVAVSGIDRHWLLSQYCSQHCGVYTYILAVVKLCSLSILSHRHRPFCPQLLLFQVHNYLPLAHNLNRRKHFTSGKLAFPIVIENLNLSSFPSRNPSSECQHKFLSSIMTLMEENALKFSTSSRRSPVDNIMPHH
jgi:hypothetical protein